MTTDWLTLNRYEGPTGSTAVYIDAAANGQVGITRYATVRFTNKDGLYTDLSLTQTSNTESISFDITPSSLVVPGVGGTYYVDIFSNTYWKVSNYDSALTIYSNNESGFGDGKLTITFPFNSGGTKTGEITLTSIAGTKIITWEQKSYAAITVTPSKCIFPQTGGSLSVVVKSTEDWVVTDYDSANTTFSALSGHSGETTITITKAALTQNQLDFYSTSPSEAIFSDGSNEAVLFLDSTMNVYYIDDDYVTVTYYVPDSAVNTDIFLYRVITGERGGSTINMAKPTLTFMDEYHTEPEKKSDPIQFVYYSTEAWFAKFTTPGYHMIKYKFPDNTLITKYMFRSSKDIVKVVVGNRCNGVIMACSLTDATNCAEIILGLGTITSIGEAVFSGCGSYDTDFVLNEGVQELLYSPFINFKARRFIYNKEIWGGEPYNQYKSPDLAGRNGAIIYGTNYGTFLYVQCNSTYGRWNNPLGPLSCRDFVFGQRVKRMYQSGFYPYGYNYYNGNNSIVISKPAATYSFDALVSAITYDNLYMLRKTPPQTPNGIPAILRTEQSFEISDRSSPPVTRTENYVFGPSPTLPFHYPIGSDYSAWLTTFTNNYEDIDI